MRLLFSAAICFGLVSSAPELSLARRHRHKNGEWGHFGRSVPAQLEKRVVGTNDFNVYTWGGILRYVVNVTVGSTAQTEQLVLEAASGDIQINSASSDACQLNATHSTSACRGGIFNPDESDTYKVLRQAPAFSATYGDGSTASGPLVEDVIGIGDVAIMGAQFLLATQFDEKVGNSVGILGLGYSTLEQTYTRYPNIVEVMVNTGIINSRLYSISLGSADAGTGSVLFGAVDTTKYSGSLTTLNILPTRYDDNTMPVNLKFPLLAITDVEATIDGQSYTVWSGGASDVSAYDDENSVVVFLDPGNTDFYLPPALFNKMALAFPYIDTSTLECDCGDVPQGDLITMTFGGSARIEFEVSQFIVPLIDETTRAPVKFSNGSDICVLLIGNDTTTKYMFALGDGLLRNMYTVYDLDNGQISVAQAVLDGDYAPNVVEVPAGPGGLAKVAANVVPAASSNPLPRPTAFAGNSSFSASTWASTVGTATGSGAIPIAAQATGMTSLTPPQVSFTPAALGTTTIIPPGPTGTGTPNPTPHPNHTGAIAGGVVGGVVGLALIGGLIAYLIRRAKRAKKPDLPEMMEG